MLQNSFYRILETSGPLEEVTSSGIPQKKFHFRLLIDPSHPVFEGHFPGNPVTPGVFQVRIIQELASQIIGMPLRLTHADNIKYLSLMVPSLHKELQCEIAIKQNDPVTYGVNATLSADSTVFIKFKGTFSADDR